jgi:hypothetical protein
MEAFALLALQFCDGEDLMPLYWSTWTMIQVGSLIAMVGIILALLHSLHNRQHPYVLSLYTYQRTSANMHPVLGLLPWVHPSSSLLGFFI